MTLFFIVKPFWDDHIPVLFAFIIGIGFSLLIPVLV